MHELKNNVEIEAFKLIFYENLSTTDAIKRLGSSKLIDRKRIDR
jgi:predicted DNA-binding protein (UPF0251 family)